MSRRGIQPTDQRWARYALGVPTFRGGDKCTLIAGLHARNANVLTKSKRSARSRVAVPHLCQRNLQKMTHFRPVTRYRAAHRLRMPPRPTLNSGYYSSRRTAVTLCISVAVFEFGFFILGVLTGWAIFSVAIWLTGGFCADFRCSIIFGWRA